MGGRGSFTNGKLRKYGWKTVGKVGDVKILKKIDGRNNKLPEYSNSPNSIYARYSEDGKFRQLRVYNENRVPILDVEYGYHKNILGLHVHYLNGDPDHRDKKTEFIGSDDPIYKRFRKIIEGEFNG